MSNLSAVVKEIKCNNNFDKYRQTGWPSINELAQLIQNPELPTQEDFNGVVNSRQPLRALM